MGRKVNWFHAVKKALETKEHKDQRPSKSKKKWFLKKKKRSHPNPNSSTSTGETATTTTATSTTLPSIAAPPSEAVKQPPILPSENVKLKEEEDEQKKHAQSIAIASAKAAEAAAAAAQAAAEVVRLTNAAQSPGKLKEEAAAISIQTAFRGHLARRALRALRGLSRMKCTMQGQTIKRQTTNTLKSMQTLARVQSQVRARRLGMSGENQAQQRQLLDKHAKDVKKVEKNGDDWNTSVKSKEQIEARLQSKHEGAVRRERALAYSFNHQRTRRNSPTKKTTQTLIMDPNNPHSGWSWLERWLAARPWETANSPDNPDHASLPTEEIAKAILHHISEKQPSATSPRSLNSPSTRAIQKQRNPTACLSTSKAQPSSPKPKTSPRRSLCCPDDEDARSGLSMQSEHNQRENVGGSSVEGDDDDDSLAGSPTGQAVPSYMAPTESAMAKSRLATDGKHEPTDRLSVSSAKKRISYPSSPARSRRSASSITDANSVAEQQCLINGK